MRILLVLALFGACAYAAPQYGYEPNNGVSSYPGRGGGHGNSVSPAGGNGGRGGDKYLPPESANKSPLINKQFFLISAPEDTANQGKSKHLVLGRPQKNYRVIFIKAPAPDNDNLKLSAEFAPQEEKTVIYVLSKKGEDIDADNIGTPAPTQPSKPEVFFIKYKTDDEAQQAQKEIQDQYDKLPGNNEYDEDTAPVTSVIGSLDSLNPDGSYNYRQVNGGNGGNGGGGSSNLSEPQVPNQQYLPSLFKH